jgi:protoheme IX farnesyltransferase
MTTSTLQPDRSTLPPAKKPRPGPIPILTSLTKLKLTAMATMPAALAYLAAPSGINLASLPLLILGVFISASGAAALNQWTERRSDRDMKRTCARPLPAGDLTAPSVLLFGLLLVGVGVGILAFTFNWLTGALTLAAGAIYWLAYTPLKRMTPWCTEVGAISGAIPCLIGWAAAEGRLDPFAWFLFAILFLWQMPHFHPIAWRHREDYARANLRMRAVAEPSGNQAANHSIFYAVALTVTTIVPFFTEQTGPVFLLVAVLMGAGYISHAIRFRRNPDRDLAARRLFRFSLIYLPVVLITLSVEYALPKFL